MEALVQRLQEIKQQISKLKNALNDTREKLNTSDAENKRLKQLIEIQNSTIKQLEEKLKIKRIADGAQNESEDTENGTNRDLKFKVNEMIREVDKIIALLHR